MTAVIRSIVVLVFCFLAAVAMVGCATTNYVPVQMQRQLPKPPVDCSTRGDEPFPRVQRPPAGKVLSPAESARWAIRARQWAQRAQARRKVCETYTRRIQNWK